MATSGKALVESSLWRAASNLTGKQWCAVKITGYVDRSDALRGGAALVDLASTGGEAIAGILVGTPLQGDAADVAFVGFPRARAGADGFVAGDKLVTEAETGFLTPYAGVGTPVAVAMETVDAGALGVVRLLSTAG